MIHPLSETYILYVATSIADFFCSLHVIDSVPSIKYFEKVEHN